MNPGLAIKVRGLQEEFPEFQRVEPIHQAAVRSVLETDSLSQLCSVYTRFSMDRNTSLCQQRSQNHDLQRISQGRSSKTIQF